MHQPSHQTIVCALPRRSIGYNDYKNCMHKQTKSKFLDLAQNELGDVWRVSQCTRCVGWCRAVGSFVRLFPNSPSLVTLISSSLFSLPSTHTPIYTQWWMRSSILASCTCWDKMGSGIWWSPPAWWLDVPVWVVKFARILYWHRSQSFAPALTSSHYCNGTVEVGVKVVLLRQVRATWINTRMIKVVQHFHLLAPRTTLNILDICR